MGPGVMEAKGVGGLGMGGWEKPRVVGVKG